MQFPHRPLKVVELKNGVLVIYDWDNLSDDTSPKVNENVQFFDKAGNLCWTINGMAHHSKWNPKLDTFVGVSEADGCLRLISFSGNSYDLDLASGQVQFAEFHK